MRLPSSKAAAQQRSINLAISARGLAAIQAIDPAAAARFLSTVIPMRGRMIHDPRGGQQSQPYDRDGQVRPPHPYRPLPVPICFIPPAPSSPVPPPLPPRVRMPSRCSASTPSAVLSSTRISSGKPSPSQPSTCFSSTRFSPSTSTASTQPCATSRGRGTSTSPSTSALARMGATRLSGVS